MNKRLDIGGQALIEGVMMKSPNFVSSAVRKPNKKIHVQVKPFKSLSKRSKILALPVIRGIVNLVEIMWLGISMLNHSANLQVESDEEEDKGGTWELIITLIVSLAIALALFKVLPLFLTKLIFSQQSQASDRILFNLIDGLIRITVFLGYLLIISQFKDVKRVFEYHGAEHMAVHTYEAGLALNANNARKFQTMHPRCGTSFLVFVLFTSILIFSIVPIDLPFFYLLFYRLLLVLPIAGVSYELLKFGAKINNKAFSAILNSPGILIQKITTRKPDNKQLEVAFKALKLVLEKEKKAAK